MPGLMATHRVKSLKVKVEREKNYQIFGALSKTPFRVHLERMSLHRTGNCDCESGNQKCIVPGN